jgi:hypothetical protein
MESDKPIPMWYRCISTKESVMILYIPFPLLYFTVHTYAVAQLVEALRYKPEGRRLDFRWCHWDFSLTQSLRSHYGTWIDSACNINEYQEYFLGVKAAGA